MATQFISKKSADFFVNIYLPELRKVTQNVHVGFFQKLTMSKKFVGMLMKIGYSFIWQEYRVGQYFSILYSELPNQLGASFAPYFNGLSNLVGGFP